MSVSQSSKTPLAPCGDFVRYERTPTATTVVCADGIGSGIKANTAAVMCVSRLFELLAADFSLREAFASVARTMTAAMGSDLPFVAFTTARLHTDGRVTVLSYESPPPIYTTRQRRAHVLQQRMFTLDQAVVGEAHCHLEPGETLMLFSDGITQAGLGAGLPEGWTIDGVCRYVNQLLAEGVPLPDLPESVHGEARRLWASVKGDDCTAVLARCRWGEVINILTGPPNNPNDDAAVVRRFLQLPGDKIVCGATTSKVVARVSGGRLEVEQNLSSAIAPPSYRLAGIDLVTEGAVTLNQVYNIYDEDPTRYEEYTGVTRLCELLRSADRINLLVGQARNVAEGDISFRQQGILPRSKIVPLLTEKLRAAGKLVVVESV